MKILLDECVPWTLRTLLPECECKTAKYCGWGCFTNGELLRLAESEFDLFITADRNLRYQQNLKGRKLAILELSTNDLRRIEAAASEFRSIVGSLLPTEYRLWVVP